jgi:hypothetical protein
LALGCLHSRHPTLGKWSVSYVRPFYLSRFFVGGVRLFEPKWLIYFSIHFIDKRTLMTVFDFVRNIRSARRCAFLLLLVLVGGYGSSTPLGITDIPVSLGCCLVDRCDSNPSWPGRLCLRRVHRTVRHNSIPSFFSLT